MLNKPFILVTNDDGINAPGITKLYKSMQEIGDVAVVAPDREMSAAGHAITLSDPLRVTEVRLDDNVTGYAVNGTPADCVKIAVKAVLDRTPDIVVSGINLGSNTGINVIYSGTVSAATEGVILGIPSVAFSLATYQDADFNPAGQITQQVVREVLEHGLPDNTLLNVNIPPIPAGEIKGIVVAKQGKGFYDEKFDKRTDPRNRVYYWMSGERRAMEEDDDSDERMVREGYVSVTPVYYDLTHYEYLTRLKNWSLFDDGNFDVRKVS
ncbi:MAG: 5'/3'-nucleotidase SurE [Candidatus Marinimicrobia bacterium]|nr:5'/3'-nucleotidase SurE [Candidatus Neomarinimicrobiota bacterium]MCF7829813.1 5'/3'-nucleotidase SurE [Candidatus Neomarinimicrobiota bacterium]MCF7881754.1 5'/3'-nucleotidase SurE [Candidatus Neomarinimicrobiota bacterium]